MPGLTQKHNLVSEKNNVAYYKLICLLLAVVMLLSGLNLSGLRNSQQQLRIVNTRTETAVTVNTMARELVLRPAVSYFLRALSFIDLYSLGSIVGRSCTDKTIKSLRVILSFIHNKDGQKTLFSSENIR